MLTLSMIVKNEEKYLEKCLESVEDIVDEVVIVDTGSTDNSKAIAQKFKAKIYDFEWRNDFSAARNYALEKSTGNYILYLDADEVLSKSSFDEIRQIKNSNTSKAYNCKIRNINEHTGRDSLMMYPRLFPNNRNLRFHGKVHEQIIRSIEINNVELVNSGIEIIHYGYNLSRDELKLKAERNLKLLLDDYSLNANSYLAFQIGQSYNIIGNNEDTAKYFQIAVRDKKLEADYLSTAHRVLSHYFMERMNLTEAMQQINKSIDYDNRQPVSFLQRAKLFSLLNQSESCFENIEQAISAGEKLQSYKGEYNQILTIDEEEILCEAIKYSLMFDDERRFKQYLSAYKRNCTQTHKRYSQNFIEITEAILSGSKIQPYKIASKIRERHLEIFLLLIKKMDIASESYFSVFEQKFSSSFLFNKEYGSYLMKQGKYKSAEERFIAAKKINNNDPSIDFFLVSISIIENQKEKALNQLCSIQERYKSNQLLQNQIRTIKEKLLQS